MQEFALLPPTSDYRLQPKLIVFDPEVSQRPCQTDACSSSLVPQCRCKPNTSFFANDRQLARNGNLHPPPTRCHKI